jgi:hypothetical protein
MIYIIGIQDMKRRGVSRYHPQAPNASVVVIQRPFSPLSLGPLIVDMARAETVSSYQDYKKWLFKTLLTNKRAIEEFTRILDIYIEEGDVVLQCSCSNDKYCHGVIIKDALEWASQFGIEDWHNQLKMKNVSK